MKPDYKNRVPKGMITELGAASAAITAASAVLGAGALGCGAFTPTDSFHTMANGNCQSRSWKVRRTM